MNEEEKEAIKTIKSFKNMKWYNHAFDKGVEILTEEERREIDIIINLIEKQQKEIEQMKTKINKTLLMIKENYNSDFYDDYETIAGLRDDIYNLLTKKYNVGEINK